MTDPLTVTVADAAGIPVTNVTVTFTVTRGAGYTLCCPSPHISQTLRN